jgi:hypothetical protein
MNDKERTHGGDWHPTMNLGSLFSTALRLLVRLALGFAGLLLLGRFTTHADGRQVMNSQPVGITNEKQAKLFSH